MVNIKLQYDEQEKQFDINVKLNIQISDPYVRVNNNIISSETTLNSVIRKIDILDKIRPGRFQQLSNKALIEQLTMEKVNVGDIIFLSDDQMYVAETINFDITKYTDLYEIAYQNFAHKPGYVLDLRFQDCRLEPDPKFKYHHRDIIVCQYVPIDEADEGELLINSMVPNLLKKGSKHYFKYRDLTLSYHDKVLDQNKSLLEQHVSPFARLDVKYHEDTAELVDVELQIYVKSLNGKTWTFCVSTRATIFDLKAQIEDKLSIRANEQRLIYGGRMLCDDDIIGRTEIDKDSTLHLVLRVRGGMLQSSSGKKDFNNLVEPAKTKFYFIAGENKILIQPHVRFSAIQQICQVIGCEQFEIVETEN